MATSKNEEVAALEALRDSSADLVRYLNAMDAKLAQLNQQNELSLRVLENWSSVIAITKATVAAESSKTPSELEDTAESLVAQQVRRLPNALAAADTSRVLRSFLLLLRTMRTNGWEKPFSKDQVVSWVLQPLLMSCFVAFVAKLLDHDKCLAILLPNAALVLLVLASWAICESRNSAEPKTASPGCFRVPAKATRYCTICCKNSPGLDHHCTWLNTCIGESNYEAFYCLVVSATLQTLGQAVVGVLMATLWFGEVQTRLSADWHEPVRALLWVHNALCLSLANSYFLLAGFHTYLLWIGSGTYDFILENGNDGLCARMLKCRCLRRSKKTKKSHVVSADSKAKQGLQSPTRVGRRPKSPPLPSADSEDAVRAAAARAAADKKQQEIAQWKAEWAAKHGADDDDDVRAPASSAGAGNTTPATAAESTPPPEANSEPANGTFASDASKVSARRSGTYPAERLDGSLDAAAIGENQVDMSISINRSEDILEDVDLGDAMGGDGVNSVGPKTDL